MYDCDNCDNSFDSKKGLGIHKSWCEDKRGTMKTEYTCQECGSTFENYESRKREGKGDHKFCSNECKHEFKRSGKVVTCSWCSDDVYKSPSQLDEMGNYPIDNHFCHKGCEASWKQEHWRGEDHPSWQGGSPTHRGDNWLEKRREALKRDGYECQVCGVTRESHYEMLGFDLSVHHKIPASEFDELEDANYLINLVTTCCGCHSKLDKISRREADKAPVIS